MDSPVYIQIPSATPRNDQQTQKSKMLCLFRPIAHCVEPSCVSLNLPAQLVARLAFEPFQIPAPRVTISTNPLIAIPSIPKWQGIPGCTSLHFRAPCTDMAVVVKNRVTPKWLALVFWKEGHSNLRSISWWLNFDPYPYGFWGS